MGMKIKVFIHSNPLLVCIVTYKEREREEFEFIIWIELKQSLNLNIKDAEISWTIYNKNDWFVYFKCFFYILKKPHVWERGINFHDNP